MKNIMLRGNSFTLFCSNLICVNTAIEEDKRKKYWTLKVTYQDDKDIALNQVTTFRNRYDNVQDLMKDYTGLMKQIDEQLEKKDTGIKFKPGLSLNTDYFEKIIPGNLHYDCNAIDFLSKDNDTIYYIKETKNYYFSEKLKSETIVGYFTDYAIATSLRELLSGKNTDVEYSVESLSYVRQGDKYVEQNNSNNEELH